MAGETSKDAICFGDGLVRLGTHDDGASLKFPADVHPDAEDPAYGPLGADASTRNRNTADERGSIGARHALRAVTQGDSEVMAVIKAVADHNGTELPLPGFEVRYDSEWAGRLTAAFRDAVDHATGHLVLPHSNS